MAKVMVTPQQAYAIAQAKPAKSFYQCAACGKLFGPEEGPPLLPGERYMVYMSITFCDSCSTEKTVEVDVPDDFDLNPEPVPMSEWQIGTDPIPEGKFLHVEVG